jgi:hypothetical protein
MRLRITRSQAGLRCIGPLSARLGRFVRRTDYLGKKGITLRGGANAAAANVAASKPVSTSDGVCLFFASTTEGNRRQEEVF